MTYPTFEELYADGPRKLWETQKSYEIAMHDRIKAKKEHGDKKALYAESMRLSTIQLKNDGTPVSGIKELARAEAVKEEIAEIKAESELSQCTMRADYLLERIQTIKKIMGEKPTNFNTTG